MHIADDAYYFPLFRVAVILIGADLCNAFADRVFIWKVQSCQCLVNNGHARPATLILFGEVPTLSQRDSHRLEVLGSHAAVAGKRFLSRFRPRSSFNPE